MCSDFAPYEARAQCRSRQAGPERQCGMSGIALWRKQHGRMGADAEQHGYPGVGRQHQADPGHGEAAVAQGVGQHRRQPMRLVGTDHVEAAAAQVDQAQDAEDQHQAGGDQAQQQPLLQSVQSGDEEGGEVHGAQAARGLPRVSMRIAATIFGLAEVALHGAQPGARDLRGISACPAYRSGCAS